MVEEALELLVSPAWRELSVGSQTLGHWVAGRKLKSDRCPFSQAVELRVGPGFKDFLPELQVRADAMSFELWKSLGLPLHSRANVCVDEALQPSGYCTLWQGSLLDGGDVAGGMDCSVMIQTVAKSLAANAARLLGAKQLNEWLRLLARRHPKLVARARREIVRDELQWVLQSLLDERASIRRLEVVLAVLLERPVSPLEAVRLAVTGDIVSAYTSDYLSAIIITPLLAREMAAGNFGTFLSLLKDEMDHYHGNRELILLCQIDELRFRLRRLIREFYPGMAVMSLREVMLSGVNVNSVIVLRSAADRHRSEKSLARDDRRRLRLKESQKVFLDRLIAESEARVRAPFL